MTLYDRFNQVIKAGDMLRFDNGKPYLVYLEETQFLIQNMTKPTCPMKLERFANKNILPAVRIGNICKIT